MIQKIKAFIKKMYDLFFNKYREVVFYLIFGGLTTLVNIATYTLFTKVFDLNYLLSNVVAWVAAVVFAYFTNKFWVFRSKTNSLKETIKEAVYFVGARVGSLAIDMGLMYLLVSIIDFNDLLSKVFVNIVIIILNYVLSKLLVFKKTEGEN